MSNSGDAAALASYVRSAARLRCDIEPFEHDQSDLIDGKKIIYCVDTNIVWLFVSPKQMSARNSDGGGGYGIIFEDDPIPLSEALGAFIARFIFFELNSIRGESGSKLPMALLPGHQNEARTLYDLVSRQLAQEDSGDEIKERKLLERFIRITNTLSHPESSIKNYAKNLVEHLFVADKPSARMRRFNNLLNEERIARSEFVADILEGMPDYPEELIKCMRGPQTLHEVFRESSYRHKWERRIAAAKPHARSSRRADVTALARLEYVNAALDTSDCKIVLITGDQGMFKASDNYYPFGERRPNFSELYLRHPRAFIASNEIFPTTSHLKSDDSDGFSTDWLDIFLARFGEGARPDTERLNKLIRFEQKDLEETASEVLKVDSAAASDFRAKWELHCRRVSTMHAFSSPIARRETERFLNLPLDETTERNLARVNASFAMDSDTSVGFFGAVTRAGYDFLAIDGAEKQLRKRNAPAISFDTLSAAREFARVIIRSNGLGKFSNADFAARIQAIDDQDSSGYSKFLAYAVLFAHAGRWHVARIIAGQALVISESIRGNRGNVSGREAYYFLAVAQRYLAKSPTELADASVWLEKAQDAFEVDRARDRPSNVSNIRFRAEKHALSLTHYLHSYFVSFCFPPSIELENLIREFCRLSDEADEMDDKWIAANVQRSVLTNMFMCFAILRNEAIVADIFERLNLYAERFFRNMQQDDLKDYLPRTELAEFVFMYARSEFALGNHSYRTLFQETIFRGDYAEKLTKNTAFAVYDKARFKMLVSVSQAALRRHGDKRRFSRMPDSTASR